MKVGEFQLGNPCGRGGMGVVYHAQHVEFGTPVAVKVIKNVGTDATCMAAFRSELRALVRLEHPNVARVFDHGILNRGLGDGFEAGSAWLAMEFCSGKLSTVARGLTNWSGLLEVLNNLLDGLAAAHSRGVVHRDLKFSNILVGTSADYRPGLKIVDFGIAAFERISDAPLSAGTPLYMAPELWNHSAGGPHSDLYSVGVLAWRMATGTLPFPRELGYDALFEQKRRGVQAAFVPRFAVPEGFEDWIRHCLAPAQRRFWCAADAAAALGNLPDTEPRPALVPPTWRTPVPPLPPAELSGAGLSLVGLKKPVFLGRVRERNQLWAALLRAQQGSVEGYQITGPPGVGATALGRWVVQGARRRSGVIGAVLRASSSDRPGVAVRRLVEALLGLWASSAQSRVGDGEAALTRLGLSSDLERSALKAVLEGGRSHGAAFLLIKAMCRVRVVVVFVDDLDLDSDLAHFLVRLRSEAEGKLLAIYRGEVGQEGFLEQRLSALPSAVIAKAVSYLVPLCFKDNQRIVECSNGRPAVAVELVRRLAKEGRLRAGPNGFEVDGDLPALTMEVAPILEGVSQSTKRALFCAAILGPRVCRRTWFIATNNTAVCVEVEGVLGRDGHIHSSREQFLFLDIAMVQALIEAMNEKRAECFSHCAEAMLQNDGDDVGIGRCLINAGETERGVAHWLCKVNTIASEHGPTVALGVMKEASELAKELPEREELQGQLANHRITYLRVVGLINEARRDARLVQIRALRKGWRKTAALAAWNIALTFHSEPLQALTALARGLEIIEGLVVPEVRGLLHYRQMVSNRSARKMDAAVVAGELAQRHLGAAKTKRSTLYGSRAGLTIAEIRGDYKNGLRFSRKVLRGERGQIGENQARIEYAYQLALSHRLEDADRELQVAIQSALIDGSKYSLANALVNRVIVKARLQEYSHTRKLALAVLAMSPLKNVREACELFLFVADAAQGRLDESTERRLQHLERSFRAPHCPERDLIFGLQELERFTSGAVQERVKALLVVELQIFDT